MCTRNPPNEAPLHIPTSMFCGLPVTDTTDPTLAPIASPIRYGLGLTRSGPSAASSTGVTTRQMVSLTNSADSSPPRSEEHTSELQSQSNLVCRLLLEKKKKKRSNAGDDQNLYCTHHTRAHTNPLHIVTV